MLALGRERAAAEGLDNLQFVERDAEELAFEEASFDAVLSRQGLQFLPDVSGVLSRSASFLKPRGRLAAAVWGPPGTVQFAAPVPVIRAELQLPPPPAGIPGPFALADADQLAELVEAAGFTDVQTGTVTAIYQTDSPELATRWLRDVAPRSPRWSTPGHPRSRSACGPRSPRRGRPTPPPTAVSGSRTKRSG